MTTEKETEANAAVQHEVRCGPRGTFATLVGIERQRFSSTARALVEVGLLERIPVPRGRSSDDGGWRFPRAVTDSLQDGTPLQVRSVP